MRTGNYYGGDVRRREIARRGAESFRFLMDSIRLLDVALDQHWLRQKKCEMAAKGFAIASVR